jgi:hypothetical protein
MVEGALTQFAEQEISQSLTPLPHILRRIEAPLFSTLSTP